MIELLCGDSDKEKNEQQLLFEKTSSSLLYVLCVRKIQYDVERGCNKNISNQHDCIGWWVQKASVNGSISPHLKMARGLIFHQKKMRC